MSIKAWWFVPTDRRLRNGDGRRVRAGITHVHKGPFVFSQSGLHASRQILDALYCASGPILCRVECGGTIVRDSGRLACSRCTYLAVVNATGMLRHFARLCALDVVGLWEAPDEVRRYLRTGDKCLLTTVAAAAWTTAESLADAARDAAEAAAWAIEKGDADAAARSAATNAARAVARHASRASARHIAREAQQKRLHRMAVELIRKHRRERNG